MDSSRQGILDGKENVANDSDNCLTGRGIHVVYLREPDTVIGWRVGYNIAISDGQRSSFHVSPVLQPRTAYKIRRACSSSVWWDNQLLIKRLGLRDMDETPPFAAVPMA